jgi:hypothetical protein
MPPVPPVTSTVLPAIGPLWICSMFVLPRGQAKNRPLVLVRVDRR